ncbi:MAG: HAD-IIB family hydrolase [Spirochaetota bacterium]|nr:HAD-IIB family hydrolase [Spirochaetota bacterium]
MDRNKKIYIQMFSIHGLLRAGSMELGRDADTGGQIKYVVELANSLSTHEEVDRVDLFTRLISDKTVSMDYSESIEQVNNKFRIVRIQCGGRKYIRKELLWPHLDEYVDKTIKFIKKEDSIPDIIHGHYADGGYVAMQLSKIFGIPFIFTGHSLGRSKREKLLGEGKNDDDIIKRYKIDTRVMIEEEILKEAELIVTSTDHEVKKQYSMYENSEFVNYKVIPPGIDIEKFYPYYHDILTELKKDEIGTHAKASVLQELNRFFLHPDKPIVLTICRPEERKNISSLIKAYGEDRELQVMANLAIFAGIRKDIHDKDENERDVLTEMLLLMDKYDLYGRMAIPKKHDFEHEVPELYRIVAEKGGVFVNPALIEPFGLTLIEAAACGVPIVATNNGGPRDIINNCKNGVLVDPTNTIEISNSIKSIIADPEIWTKYSRNGIMNVRKHYTWKEHADDYLKNIRKLVSDESQIGLSDKLPGFQIGKRLVNLNYLIASDIDNTLIGKDNHQLKDFIQILNENFGTIVFCVATGRTVESAVEYLKLYNLPVPDIIVSAVGTEIYYSDKLIYDKGWDSHISQKWDRIKIVDSIKKLDFLEYQEEDTQRKFKISYFMKPGKDRLAIIHDLLLKNRCYYSLIYSHDRLLDIVPYRASKGKAVRYLSYKWEIPLENMLVCGDSGNDEYMLRGDTLGVVVGNYSRELENLKGLRNVFFASQQYAGGIIEGINYYRFIEKATGKVFINETA